MYFQSSLTKWRTMHEVNFGIKVALSLNITHQNIKLRLLCPRAHSALSALNQTVRMPVRAHSIPLRSPDDLARSVGVHCNAPIEKSDPIPESAITSALTSLNLDQQQRVAL